MHLLVNRKNILYNENDKLKVMMMKYKSEGYMA